MMMKDRQYQQQRHPASGNSIGSSSHGSKSGQHQHWRIYLWRSVQFWALLAMTSWCFQFFLVTRLTAQEGHFSLVQADHQQQERQARDDSPKLQAISSQLSTMTDMVTDLNKEVHSLRATVAFQQQNQIQTNKNQNKKHEQQAADDTAADEHATQHTTHISSSTSSASNNDNDTTSSDMRNNNKKEKDEIKYYNCTNENDQLVTLQQVPSFIIIGAQKAGTSAMYDLLNLHPGIQGSIEPEAHFFDRRLPINELSNPKNKTWAERYRCKVREIYAKKFFPYDMLEQNPHLKFFDKTPSYVTSNGAPFRIKAIAPWSKVILSLRNPVHRAFSQYRMEFLPNQPHLSFEERLGVSLDVLRRKHIKDTPATDNFPRPSRELMSYNTTSELAEDHFWRERNIIHRGYYVEQLQPWLQYYTLGKDLLVVRYEEFQTDPETVLNKIFDFVGAERPPPNNTVYTNETLSQKYGPGRLRGTKGFIAEVPPPEPESLEFLAKLYKPHNDELADLLGEEWRGVWDDY